MEVEEVKEEEEEEEEVEVGGRQCLCKGNNKLCTLSIITLVVLEMVKSNVELPDSVTL